jgi:signal transduction histidine kinase
MRKKSGDETAPIPAGGVLASLPLEHKLPLLIGALLLMVIGAFSIAAYMQVRNDTVAAADDRLKILSGQLRDLFQQSGAQMRAQATTAAADPALSAYVRSPDATHRQRALAALQYKGPQPEQILATELRDESGRVLLSTNSQIGVDTIGGASVADRSPLNDSSFVGQFRLLRDTMVYAVVSPLAAAEHANVVIWRRLVGSRRTREQLAKLVGSDAMLFLGNPGGTPWTDLERPVAHPDSAARITPIPGTAWAIGVEFPRDRVLAPVNQLLRRFALIAIISLIVGLAGAWAVTRRITVPLRRLTVAAGSIASGNYVPPPRIERSDELGQLAAAFATMATEVRDARAGLEEKVEHRTQELNHALEELSETQSALVRREKLAILGQLAGGVGHELRNPLGVMTNAVYYLKMVLAAQPGTVHEYLEILQQQITLSEKIVSDLLDFARSKPPQRSRASLSELTEAQIARLGSTNGVKIDSSLIEGPQVFVDQVQIGQIILNLLTNAVQALDGSGTVSVRIGRNAAVATVDVIDSGPGVPAANLERIFEPLFTTKARGIGLGLAVSRTLARANDGELSVFSPPGEGATFRLVLPIADGAPG